VGGNGRYGVLLSREVIFSCCAWSKRVEHRYLVHTRGPFRESSYHTRVRSFAEYLQAERQMKGACSLRFLLPHLSFLPLLFSSLPRPSFLLPASSFQLPRPNFPLSASSASLLLKPPTQPQNPPHAPVYTVNDIWLESRSALTRHRSSFLSRWGP